MALNVAPLLQMAQQVGQSNPYGDMMKNRSVRANNKSATNLNNANAGRVEQETAGMKQEQDAFGAAKERVDMALIATTPWLGVKDFFTPDFKDKQGDGINALGASLGLAERNIAIAQAKGGDAREWVRLKSVIEGARAAKGTPNEEIAMGSLNEYFTSAKQGEQMLKKLSKVKGFEYIGMAEPDAAILSSGSQMRDPATGALIADNPQQFSPQSNFETIAPDQSVLNRNTGEIGAQAATKPARPGEGNKVVGDDSALVGPQGEELYTNFNSEVFPGFDQNDVSTTQLVSGVANILGSGTGMGSTLIKWAENNPITAGFVDGSDEVKASYALNSLTKDLEAAFANNPRYAEGEMRRLASSITNTTGGFFQAESGLRYALEQAQSNLTEDMALVSQSFNAETDDVNRRKLSFQRSHIVNTLIKLDQMLQTGEESSEDADIPTFSDPNSEEFKNYTGKFRDPDGAMRVK